LAKTLGYAQAAERIEQAVAKDLSSAQKGRSTDQVADAILEMI
jgi:hypothetical protein